MGQGGGAVRTAHGAQGGSTYPCTSSRCSSTLVPIYPTVSKQHTAYSIDV